ncbi:MAG: DUF4397 domain-containing protein [Chloroflexota bacterium]
MKKSIKFGIALLVIIATVIVTSASVMAQSGNAMLRFVHAIPGASAVDVYTDGQLTISGLDFGTASTYVTVSSGDHQLKVTSSGSTNALWEQTVSAADGSATTLVAASASDPSFLVYPEDLSPIGTGKARLTAIHAISGGPAVDLMLGDGRPVIPGLQFGQAAGTLDVPAFAYDFAVAPSGQTVDKALVKATGVALDTGTSNMLVVYGTSDKPQTLVLSSATKGDSNSGFVRIAHGVSGAPAIDVYINGSLAIPSLPFGGFTQHIAVPAGSYDISIRAVGSDKDIATATLPVTAGEATTAAVLGTSDKISVNVFKDNISGVTADKATLSLANGIPTGTVSAKLEDGTSLASDLAFGAAADAVSIDPAKAKITVTSGDSSVDIPAESFYGGVYYNLIAVNDGGTVKLLGAPTSLAQGVASAPGAAAAAVAAAPTVAPTLPPQPTVAPVEPTTAPVATVVPDVAAPTQAPVAATNGPTARVFNLDANANLQMRQYPNSDALSLSTVPPGTVLVVNGREGAITEIPFSATPKPAEDYQFVDPATLLTDPKADLVPEQTWLNVTYATPDGGSITAWANALYLDVRNPRGEKIKLASLPLVSSNLPGSIDNTTAAAPAVPANHVAATVFNLDTDVNLNIRRTPDPDAEVLARVPNGTVMELLGLKEDQQWAFVSYSPATGGTVTGWVNITYIQYSYNGKAMKLEELSTRNLLVTTPDDTRGDVTEGIGPAVVPTVNPTKNAYVAKVALESGSNLNLRREADANSEVLAPIPAGTQVIVISRTEDGNWLNVTYEDQDGWIAAKTDVATFVDITYNGKPAQISDIPVTGGAVQPPAEQPGSTSVGPTATPDANSLNLPVRVADAFVMLTGSPGGENQGLPGVSRGQEATLIFTDGKFSYIELPDGTKGWVPAGAVQPR